MNHKTTDELASNSRQENPYVGPKTFQEADRDYFFGREREAQALLSFVIVEPLVLFTAQSGAGKSSLINTRLKPQLEAKGFNVFVSNLRGHSVVEQEGVDNIYVYNLLSGLEDKKRDELALPQLPPAELARQSLSSYLEANLLSNKPFASLERPPRLLIIDQFEEIVTTYPAYWQHRAPFFWQLNQIMQKDPLLWVLLTMREDHVASLDPYLYLLKDRLRARFYMQRLDIISAVQAIEAPALMQGRAFTTEATHVLIESLRRLPAPGMMGIKGNFIEPLQLQVVCYELWQKLKERPGERITGENLAYAFGDLNHAVEEALARFYNEAVVNVVKESGVSEFDIRYWFEQHLITNLQTRGAVYQGETRTADLPNEVVRRLNDRFLLHSETHAGSVWYELIHDRFILPVIESNNAWFTKPQNQLFLAVREWEREKQHDPDKLFTEDQLARLSNEEKADPSPFVQQFLHTSQERSKEETIRLLREQEAKQAKVARSFVWALVIALIGLLAAIPFARSNMSEAKSSESTAVAINGTAVAEENRAINAFNEADAEAEAAAAFQADALVAQGTAEAASTLTISEANAASTASVLSVIARETAVAASNIAATEEAQADLARNVAATQEALAEAARDAANIEAEIAQMALEKVEVQREQVLAQSLAINALNVIRSNNDTELATLLALEANKINQEQTADEDIQEIIEQTFLNIFAQPYFNVTLQEGHEGRVEAMAFTSDGRKLVSAGVDGTIRLWDLDQPDLPHMRLEGDADAVDFIRITPDGRTVVTASRNGLIQVWRLDGSNSEPVQFTETLGEILSLAVAPSGQEVALVVDSLSARVRFWPLQENGEPSDPDGITSRVVQTLEYESLIYAPDGSEVYALYPNTNPLSIIRVDRSTLNFEEHLFLPLAYSPDGEIAAYYNNPLVSGAGNFRIARSMRPFSLFDINNDTETLSMPVAFDHTNTLVADTNGSQIGLWRLHKVEGRDTVTFLTDLIEHTGQITALAFAPDGTLASADDVGTIRLWYPHQASTAIAHGASQINFSPINGQVAWLEGGRLTVQDFDDFAAGITVTNILTGYDVHLNSLAFSPDGEQIAAGGGPLTGRGVVYIWQMNGPPTPVEILEGHVQPVQTIAFSPDGQVLASGSGLGEYHSGDDTVLIWDLNNPETPSHRLTAHTKIVNEVQFSPDGSILASASSDGTIRFWQTEDYDEFGEPLSLPSDERALSLAFSNDGTQLVAGSGNTTIRNVSPSGTIYLWTLSNLTAAPRILTEHSYWINDLAFAPDDELLVSASEDGTVQLWQFETGFSTSLVLVGHEQAVRSVAFAPDGRLVSADANAIQLHITPEQLLERGCNLVHRNLSWAEWQRYIDKPTYTRTCSELPTHPSVPPQS